MKYDIYDDDGDENWSGSQARLTYSTDCIWQGRKVNIFFTSNIKIDADDDGVMTLYFWVWEKVQVKEEGGR